MWAAGKFFLKAALAFKSAVPFRLEKNHVFARPNESCLVHWHILLHLFELIREALTFKDICANPVEGHFYPIHSAEIAVVVYCGKPADQALRLGHDAK